MICQDTFYRHTVTVDSIIFTVGNGLRESYRKLPEKKLQVLLAKRAIEPHAGKWGFIGSIVRDEERFDDAIQRSLKEKANIKDIYLEQLYTWGDPKRDPRERVISASYMGLIDSDNIKLKAGSSVDDVKWFDVKVSQEKEKTIEKKEGYQKTEDLEITLTSEKLVLTSKVKVVKEFTKGNWIIYTQILKSDLAFDHAKMLIYALERLKNKVEYTTIAFNLMPEKFTLTELQQVYEILLDRPLLKANFRRKIYDMVVETEEYEETAGHRPSKLFTFNTNWQPHVF